MLARLLYSYFTNLQYKTMRVDINHIMRASILLAPTDCLTAEAHQTIFLHQILPSMVDNLNTTEILGRVSV